MKAATPSVRWSFATQVLLQDNHLFVFSTANFGVTSVWTLPVAPEVDMLKRCLESILAQSLPPRALLGPTKLSNTVLKRHQVVWPS